MDAVTPLRRLTLLAVVVAVALVLAGGAALAADMIGTSGDDTLTGTAGDDRIAAGDGNDRLFGGAGNDQLTGGLGNDYLHGGVGLDALVGGEGADTIYDGPANDASEDSITGGGGPDRIYSANDPVSRDLIDCGSGYDVVTADTLDVFDEVTCEDVTVVLTPEQEAAQASAEQTAPPAEISAQGIGGTACVARVDRTHRSGYDSTEAKSIIGIWRCDVKKKRIWISASLQRWLPFDNRWQVVRYISDNDYDTFQNLKHVVWRCPSVREYWYRGVLHDATIADYDGDKHYLRYSVVGEPNRFRCLS